MGSKDKGGRNTKKVGSRDLKQKRSDKKAKKAGTGGTSIRVTPKA